MGRLGMTMAAICLLSAGPVAAAPAGKSAPLDPKAQGQIDKAYGLVGTDPDAALALMKQIAETGDPEAINGLAVFIDRGVGQTADPDAAMAMMEQALAKGSIGARLNIGTALLTDSDADNDARGVDLLLPLTKNDAVAGQTLYPLGRAMLLGLGGRPQDIDGGLSMLELGERFNGDNEDLLFLLGRAHQNGWGSWDPNPVKAAGYFRRSAELGDPRAQWNYAMALLNGEGVAISETEAWKWVKASGEAGYRNAQVSTAVMLAIGQGVAEDDVQARAWYEKAALAGSAHALSSLGMMLITGEGGPVDAVTGQAYLELAAAGGGAFSKRLLDERGIAPTAGQRATIDRIKASWRGMPPRDGG